MVLRRRHPCDPCLDRRKSRLFPTQRRVDSELGVDWWVTLAPTDLNRQHVKNKVVDNLLEHKIELRPKCLSVVEGL